MANTNLSCKECSYQVIKSENIGPGYYNTKSQKQNKKNLYPFNISTENSHPTFNTEIQSVCYKNSN